MLAQLLNEHNTGVPQGELFGAKIYVDPLRRSTVRIDDHEIEFHQEVCIQGHRYMDPYATMYLIVKDPQLYNQWGIKDNKNKGKSPIVEDVETPLVADPNLFHRR